jgi:hypothetical protein
MSKVTDVVVSDKYMTIYVGGPFAPIVKLEDIDTQEKFLRWFDEISEAPWMGARRADAIISAANKRFGWS